LWVGNGYRFGRPVTLEPGGTTKIEPGAGLRLSFELPQPGDEYIDWPKTGPFEIINRTEPATLGDGFVSFSIIEGLGRFVVDGVEPGTYAVWGWVGPEVLGRPGHSRMPMSRPFTVSAPDGTREVDLGQLELMPRPDKPELPLSDGGERRPNREPSTAASAK
jgi:hypothetical protein